MPYLRLSVLFLLFCAFALAGAEVRAQGFNAFSGRNHPELDWRVARTEHFEIMYPARLAGIEAEAAPIAEASYAALSANLGVAFDERIRIYLSDEDEVTNGFAVPIGNGYTNIWVHMNDVAEVWTGREKWLRKVIAHELVHIFHYRAVRSPLHPFDHLLAEPLPRFWTEGLAQYETETWDAQRGDRWLRTAVLDDQLSYQDGRSAWNGRLLYAVGNAQVRFFAEQYGDSTLARLLAHRKPVLFGLARVHDFDTAFEAVTDESYRAFSDRWRRHLNVYYNTLAGQMETPDSLGVEAMSLPGQYLYDVRHSPDTSRVAVLSLASLARPVRRLYVVDRDPRRVRVVAEGAIKAPVSWSPDGRRLAFARTARGEHGSLLNDLYVVGADGDGLRRLTHSRRAAAPAFSPDGRRLAFIGSEGGTANVFVLDLETGAEAQHTRFEGDVQLSGLRWHPTDDRLVFARFAADGTRDLVVLELETGDLRPVTSGEADDRTPVWSPDGRRLAYTSLRDLVPNVFVYDPATDTHRRVTRLVTGAFVHDWLPSDSAHAGGRLVVVAGVTKRGDQAYAVDAARTVLAGEPEPPEGFAAWTRHRPPAEVPVEIPPDPSLIQSRGPYRAFANLTHAGTLVLPYYGGANDWGLFGFTSWVEPLGKHVVALAGAVSLPAPLENSAVVGSYVNNQFYPSLALSGYRLPGSARVYGSDLLVETLSGGDLTALWPLVLSDRPYTSTSLAARLRYVDVDPLNPEVAEDRADLPAPEAGQQADLRLAFTHRAQRPYRLNVIHPLDGFGVRLQATGAARVLGADRRFFRADAAAYGVLRLPLLPSLHRLFVYGRAQVQTGDPFPQNYLGFSRTDDVQIGLPGVTPVSLGDAERVRGYRSYALGTRMLFGSVEYRLPLLPDLQTRILGTLGLGATALALFADAGVVWTGDDLDGGEQRLGVGVELKNALRLGGVVELMHAVGFAQPASVLGTDDDYEVYYRVRTALPF